MILYNARLDSQAPFESVQIAAESPKEAAKEFAKQFDAKYLGRPIICANGTEVVVFDTVTSKSYHFMVEGYADPVYTAKEIT